MFLAAALAAAPLIGLIPGCSGGSDGSSPSPTATAAPTATLAPTAKPSATPTAVPTVRPTAVPSPTPSDLNAFNLRISEASGSNVTEGTLDRVFFYLNDNATAVRAGDYQGSLQQGGSVFNGNGYPGLPAQRISILIQKTPPFFLVGDYTIGPDLSGARMLIQLAQYDGNAKIWEGYAGSARVTAVNTQTISLTLNAVKLRPPAGQKNATGTFTISGTATLAIGSRKLT